MTGADDDDESARRHERVVAAAVRAAYAWSGRAKYPDAMLEISRMTGVVMEARGRGFEPTTPMGLVEWLRRPLGGLLSFATSADPAVAEAVLLDSGGEVTDAVYDVGCEYAQQLDAALETAPWLPSWARMRAAQVRAAVFASMVEAGDQEAYVKARRFLIEMPAGKREDIADQLAETGTRCAATYQDIPADQQHAARDRRWWWPCPVCRWPMHVTSETVRCRYRPHRAAYQIDGAQRPGTVAPRLLRVREDGPAPPRGRPADGAACLDASVWRHVVVPGATEIRLASEWDKNGVMVMLWPKLDTYDLDVRTKTEHLCYDVKEYQSARRLVDDLRAKPPAATVLLPATHEHQLEIIRSALPGIPVTTERQARRRVRQAAREAV